MTSGARKIDTWHFWMVIAYFGLVLCLVGVGVNMRQVMDARNEHVRDNCEVGNEIKAIISDLLVESLKDKPVNTPERAYYILQLQTRLKPIDCP